MGCTTPVSSSETLLSSEEIVISNESSEEVPTDYENPVWELVLADPAIIRGDDGIFMLTVPKTMRCGVIIMGYVIPRS